MDDKTLLSLVEKFGSSSIAELELNDSSIHLVLRKESAVRTGTTGTNTSATAGGASGIIGEIDGAAGGSHTDQRVHLGLPVNSGTPAAEGELITSPIVATFYRSPSPDTAPFVDVGTKVKAGQTLCILEAMKMMNHLEAEFDCEILAIKANNGDMVEYGQPLFEVKRL
ncbi:MAG: acetyl-CoA carboxylase biotin carboxyl carrier protein [Termitinemataceae bacterium]